jgi:TetR/AcrR family transcriptional regulator, fatty acid metabolism regulator protein
MRTRTSDSRRTFTELARRAQIAGCAAEAIAEVGYADASMAEIARRAGVAKSVVSYHFSDRAELMGEVLRTAMATYATFMEPRMARATSASDKLRAYVVGTADYVVEQRSMHVAVIEIALNATSADGRPLIATMPLRAPEPSVEDILRQGQRDGEFRDFDVQVVGGVVRSALTRDMVVRQRNDPRIDLQAYAEELVRLFELGIRR